MLWERDQEGLGEDFARTLPIEQATQTALADINNRSEEFGMSCEGVGLPTPNIVLNPDHVDSQSDVAIATHNLSILNDKQREIVDDVLTMEYLCESCLADVCTIPCRQNFVF